MPASAKKAPTSKPAESAAPAPKPHLAAAKVIPLPDTGDLETAIMDAKAYSYLVGRVNTGELHPSGEQVGALFVGVELLQEKIEEIGRLYYAMMRAASAQAEVAQ